MPYAPSPAEVKAGMKLTCVPLYAGGWRAALITYSLVQGVALGVAFIFLSYLLALFFGDVPGPASYLIFVFFALLSLAYWILERLIKNRGARFYLDSLLMRGQELGLSSEGIMFTNGRSRTFLDWRDVERIVETPEMLVATLGYQGIVMPDRILAEAGDPAAIRSAIKAWHDVAGAAP